MRPSTWRRLGSYHFLFCPSRSWYRFDRPGREVDGSQSLFVSVLGQLKRLVLVAVARFLELCLTLRFNALTDLASLLFEVSLLHELLEDWDVRLRSLDSLGTSASPIEFLCKNQPSSVHNAVSFGQLSCKSIMRSKCNVPLPLTFWLMVNQLRTVTVTTLKVQTARYDLSLYHGILKGLVTEKGERRGSDMVECCLQEATKDWTEEKLGPRKKSRRPNFCSRAGCELG